MREQNEGTTEPTLFGSLYERMTKLEETQAKLEQHMTNVSGAVVRLIEELFEQVPYEGVTSDAGSEED